jgi:16S rRNA G966 N2-methylase RsmD
MFGSDFVLYDYRSPLDIPRELRESFDLVFADPPFLSEECLTKTAVTIKYLAKEKIVLCTGAVMAELAERLLRNECAQLYSVF